jgi:hypothetical protein
VVLGGPEMKDFALHMARGIALVGTVRGYSLHQRSTNLAHDSLVKRDVLS